MSLPLTKLRMMRQRLTKQPSSMLSMPLRWAK
jgi:hypothetical protein